MANIVYISSSDTPTVGEQSFIDRITGTLGHSITVIEDAVYTTAMGVGFDAMMLGNSLREITNADILSTPLKLLIHGGTSAGEFGLGDNAGAVSNLTQIEIFDAASPLSAGLPLGVASVATVSMSFFRQFNMQASVTVAYAEPGASATTGMGFSIESGGLLFDGVSTAPEKRVGVFGYDGGDMNTSNLTAQGLAIFDAAVTELVGGVVVTPKLEGTLTPWDTQVPAANLTGVKYSVRSDLQTSDNQVLSGTTTTNASGQFSIEDAALSPATTYYVTFENDAGTVFATHKITTS